MEEQKFKKFNIDTNGWERMKQYFEEFDVHNIGDIFTYTHFDIVITNLSQPIIYYSKEENFVLIMNEMLVDFKEFFSKEGIEING